MKKFATSSPICSRKYFLSNTISDPNVMCPWVCNTYHQSTAYFRLPIDWCVSNGPFTQNVSVSIKSCMENSNVNSDYPHRASTWATTLTLQSEWVMYPFLSVVANANALWEQTSSYHAPMCWSFETAISCCHSALCLRPPLGETFFICWITLHQLKFSDRRSQKKKLTLWNKSLCTVIFWTCVTFASDQFFDKLSDTNVQLTK